MFQVSRSYSCRVIATFAKKCREFIDAPRPFGPPRSPFAAGNNAIKHTQETSSTGRDVRRVTYIAERGVGSYGQSHVDGFRNANVFATPGCRLPQRVTRITESPQSWSASLGGGVELNSGRSLKGLP
jgi:hypothetical protein